MIPPTFVEELLSRTDIVEVVGRHVELRKGGANYMGLCPFHGEKSPSFSVSPSKQFYYCFGCGASGDAVRFLTEHLGMNFRDAVQDLAQRVGLAMPDEQEASPADRARAAQARERAQTLASVLAQAAAHYQQQLKGAERAVGYLKGRGLSGAIAKRYGLGFAPPGWRNLASAFARYDDPLLVEAGLVITQGEGEDDKRYDRFRDRVVFPIRNVRGEVIGFGGRVLDGSEPKYLNSPETPVFSKGHELYGLFEARTALRSKGYALVTEGYMDVVALAQLGLPNAVATLGTACTDDHVRLLLRFTDHVVFSFDGDAAGRRAAARALAAALPHASDTRSFRFLFLPPEHDPDSYVRAHGAAAFEALVQAAEPLSRQLIALAADGADTTSAEGRARLLAQARPLWQSLPEGVLRVQVLGELAQAGQMPLATLQQQWLGTAPARPGAPHAVAARRQGPRQGGRPAPTRADARVVQMLFGQPDWWQALAPADQDVLHALPGAPGEAMAWLERDIAEHGCRPWAVLRVALAADAQLSDAARAAADGDADPEATPADLRRALDVVLLADLDVRMQALLPRAANDADARRQAQALAAQRAQLKQRLAQGESPSDAS